MAERGSTKGYYMTTIDALSEALASAEAQLHEERGRLEDLRRAGDELDPRAKLPVSTEELAALESASAPRRPPAPTRPALWSALRG